MAKMRADETKEYVFECKAKNRNLMVNTRNEVNPIIEEFLAKVKVGPEYVCTHCHTCRKMYKHSVVTFRCTKCGVLCTQYYTMISD